MKRLLVPLLVLAMVVVFPMAAAANDEPTPGVDDPDWTFGEGIFADYEAFKTLFTSSTATGANYKTITNATVTGSMGDIIYDPGNQDGAVIINTLANIPCYLEMELIGNAGYTKLKSQGTDSTGTVDRTNEAHWMFFDSGFGGFVGEDWESIGEGTFSQIGPNREGRTPVYIQACDMWTANLYANIEFGFDVIATSLANNDDEFLMDMRHTLAGAAGWTEHLQIGQAEVGEFDALDPVTVYMQFRVPYAAVPAGQYNGDITFKIYSI